VACNSFIAKANGIVATEKDIIARGARMPVRTSTAAMGKKTMPNGICRRSRHAINDFFVQGRVDLDERGNGAIMGFVSVTPGYVVIAHSVLLEFRPRAPR
jgi:hypothetical protein